MWHLGVQLFNIHFKTIVMEMENGDRKLRGSQLVEFV